MSAARKAAYREKLFHQQRGLCYWCKQPMRLVPREKPHHNDPAACTLDHLHDRWSPLRGAGGYRNVAACNKCNLERSIRNEARAMMRNISMADAMLAALEKRDADR